VQPELSGSGYLLCILTLGSIQADLDQLIRGLEELGVRRPPNSVSLSNIHPLAARVAGRLPEMDMTPRDAFYSKQKTIPLAQAMHRVASEIITPYPPGIPVMMPGERFDHDTIEFLESIKRSGCPISAVDPSINTVRVVA
jgi:arginine decarboxylase